MMRRTVLAGIAAALTVALTSCGGGQPGADNPYGLITPGTLLAATSGD